MATVITELGTNLTLPDSFGSLADFRDWIHSDARPARGRFTFTCRGFEIDMSPERISGHNEIKAQLYVVVGSLVESQRSGKIFPDGALLVNEDADLGCEPDMLFCNWETLRSGRVAYRAWKRDDEGDVELWGSPDLVVEVISNSSVRKDTIDLRRAYFDAGITEYWLIDGRNDEIEFSLLIRGENCFVPVTLDADGFLESSVLGRKFRFVREQDPIGGFQCRLLVQ